jgi:hypothetical protein
VKILEIEKLLEIFLSSFLVLESVCVPIVGYLISQYSEAKKMNLKIASTYYKMTWLIILILILSALGTIFSALYFVKIKFIEASYVVPFTIGVFLLITILIPLCLLYLWIEETKRKLR